MLKPRVIPCLLLKNNALVKTVRFNASVYIGDPLNAVRIFNQKEVDELLLLDIEATAQKRMIPLDVVKRVAEECLMPLTVGGGVKSVEEMEQLFQCGVEKVSLNSQAFSNLNLVEKAADRFGSQAVVVAMDVKKHILGGYEVYGNNGKKSTGLEPEEYAKSLEKSGAGEILVYAIDRDGMTCGYDVELIKRVSSAVNIPVIACGGCGSLNDISQVIFQGGASAAAAGSFFVFHGPRKAVLINFPDKRELEELFSQYAD